MRLDSPLELLREIDPICERFEAELRAESKPRIEDYLQESRPEVRATLLAHLLELELDYRDRRHIERPHAARSTDAEEAGAPAHQDAQALGPAALVRSPGTRFGPFLLLRELGRGGMGVVYEALQPELDRRVALKLMSPGLVAQPDFLKRFRREARAAARLHHSHIVQLYEFGQESAVPYIAFQFVEGGSLADRLYEERRAEAGTPLGRGRAREIAKIGAEIASALAYAHGQGVLHRDLKPANILLDPSGAAYLGDFGLARIEEDERSQPSGVVGTLRYMAPESLRGEADARSDIYSLGATLYDWVALLPLSEPRDASGGITSERVPPLRERRAGVPLDLETILLRALEPEPDRRFATAADFAAELEAFLGDRPIASRRPSPIERWWRWQRRNPLLGAALLGLALCLLAIGVGSTLAATSFRRTAHELLVRSRSEQRLREDLATQLSRSEVARAFRAMQDAASHGALDQIVRREKGRSGGALPSTWEWRLIDAVASQRHRECGGPRDGVGAIALQPGGRWLSAAGQSVHFFDTIEECWYPERDVALRGDDLSWDASGRYLGVAANGAHVLDFRTGAFVGELEEPEVDRLALHPHLPILAASLRTRDLVIYDWSERREILRLERVLIPMWRFAFSPSGEELAFLSPHGVGVLRLEDGSVRHHACGEVLLHMPVIWHPSGKAIVTGIDDGAALLDARSGALLGVLSTASRYPVDLAFDAHGRRLALTAHDNAIHLFDLDPSTLLEPQPKRSANRILRGIETRTTGARIDAAGRQVYAGASYRPLHVWDLDRAPAIRTFGSNTPSGPYIAMDLQWEESTRSLWSSTRSGVQCWSPTGGARGERIVGARTPALSGDERWLALVSGPRIRILERATRATFREAEHAAHFLAWHPREERLFSADPFEIRAWDFRREAAPHTLGVSALRLVDMDLGADGRWLWFARGEDLAGMDTESGEFHIIQRAEEGSGLFNVEADPHSHRVACGYDDGSLQVYDAERRRFGPRMKGHGLRIRDLAWSPNGSRLASVSSDASIRLWDPERGEELATLQGPRAMAKVCWSADGEVLAALSDQGRILVWDASASGAESPPR